MRQPEHYSLKFTDLTIVVLKALHNKALRQPVCSERSVILQTTEDMTLKSVSVGKDHVLRILDPLAVCFVVSDLRYKYITLFVVYIYIYTYLQ